MSDDNVVIKAKIEWKLEKFNEKGELIDTLSGVDETTPEVARQYKELLDQLPDNAVNGGKDGTN